MAPFSQELEPPRNPVRFILPSIRKTSGFVEGVSGRLGTEIEKAAFDQLRRLTDQAVKMNDKLDRYGFDSKSKSARTIAYIASELHLPNLVVQQMVENPNPFKESLPR